MEDALERVGAAMCLKAPGAARGVKGRIVCRGGEANYDRARVIQKAYNVTFWDVR